MIIITKVTGPDEYPCSLEHMPQVTKTKNDYHRDSEQLCSWTSTMLHNEYYVIKARV